MEISKVSETKIANAYNAMFLKQFEGTKIESSALNIPCVVQEGSDGNIANTPLGVAAVEVAREKIGVDDHAYSSFDGFEWLVRQLRPYHFWISRSGSLNSMGPAVA